MIIHVLTQKLSSWMAFEGILETVPSFINTLPKNVIQIFIGIIFIIIGVKLLKQTASCLFKILLIIGIYLVVAGIVDMAFVASIGENFWSWVRNL